MMFLPILIVLANFMTGKADECTKTYPIKIGNQCYRFQTDLFRYQEAHDNCANVDKRGRMTSVRTQEVMDAVEKIVFEFISKKLEKALFWVGFGTDDNTFGRKKQDRIWKMWHDGTEIVQKEYPYWEVEGGPTKEGIYCAAMHPAENFLVKPLDCGGSKLPIVCMNEKGKPCKGDAAPYMTYGDYCLATISMADAYPKVEPGCNPGTGTPYTAETMDYVRMSANNSFLGGALYMNIKKENGRFIDQDTMLEPDGDMWEKGEPRDEYECVGLSQQLDGSLKLKTMGCGFFAASLCVLQLSETE